MSTSDDVKKLREAFEAGARYASDNRTLWQAPAARAAEAARRYPLPLRVIEAGHNKYRMRDGKLELLGVYGDWIKSVYTVDIVRALYDLMQRPYEDDAPTVAAACTHPSLTHHHAYASCDICGMRK